MKRRGFTMIEAAAIVGVCGLGATVLGVVHGSAAGPRDRAKLLKDATQLRGIGQALIVFASNNDDRYPTPSRIDRANGTVDADPRSKDHTAAVYSILIYNGFFDPEMFISPLEDNPQIKADGDYQYEEPEAAARPDRALWDPSFSIDFTGDRDGHASYAHQQLSDDRLPTWANTFNASEAQFSTRGPKVTGVSYAGDGSATPTLENPKSRTLGWYREGLLGKKGDAWSGNIAFADNHTEARVGMIKRVEGDKFAPISLEDHPFPRLRLKEDQREVVDVIFHDEAGAPRNAYLGLWITAGAKPEDFRGAWD
ncbi:MAG: type II secretion system protein [Phycisphaerales bacterium JB037]